MNNRFIIYGPPASGKSTLLRTLSALLDDCVAVDLELVGSKEKSERIALIQCLANLKFKGPLFVGAADLSPQDFPEPFKVVLLLYTEKSLYLARVASRNEIKPHKANQNEAHFFDCFTKGHVLNPNWIHIDPASFEGGFEAMAKHLLKKLGLVEPA